MGTTVSTSVSPGPKSRSSMSVSLVFSLSPSSMDLRKTLVLGRVLLHLGRLAGTWGMILALSLPFLFSRSAHACVARTPCEAVSSVAYSHSFYSGLIFVLHSLICEVWCWGSCGEVRTSSPASLPTLPRPSTRRALFSRLFFAVFSPSGWLLLPQAKWWKDCLGSGEGTGHTTVTNPRKYLRGI